jgi:BirA family biotin operon repressor/biotin-[acetyl-CoA-carboxylase] ligase
MFLENIKTMDLDENYLREQLKGRMVGDPLWVLPEVSSTNEWLKDFVRRNSTPSGAMVVADYQTSGRGRMWRQWISPAGTGLLCSFYWIPRLSISQWAMYSLASALAVYDLLMTDVSKPEGRKNVRFRWPNDILVGRKKISGILGETATAQGIVIGIGLNVLQKKSQLPGIDTTSVYMWTRKKFSRSELLVKLVSHLETRLMQLDQGNFSVLIEELNSIGPKLDSAIQVKIGGNILSGTYQGLSSEGTLLLKTNDNLVHNIATADEVRILK